MPSGLKDGVGHCAHQSPPAPTPATRPPLWAPPPYPLHLASYLLCLAIPGMVGSSDRRHLPAGHPAQLIRGESENGARGACGGPNLLVLKQGFVENGVELPGVANRRNASDGETRPLEHEAWIGLEHRLMDQSMDLLLIDSMCAACNDQDWTPGILDPGDDRLCQ